ncbi:gap junction protein alpha 4 [Toxotes jaculatrix]|uniref:gap junction protein alpha 4 n=1 Tax=Toxotes jaculatrix TaxID=941984 RepID=UPI001B3AA2CF|nr:gap junction protein alpha 4 [Toxotes jaculatrix]XP_040910055.1 gap junction protein alpha 4 [Toxotes jaculatrix]
MSKADWSFLEHLLEEGQEYSTGIGRVWLTVLFLFRILVLGTAAESAWDDEQADFVCNTRQPGCTAVCYDKAFPISHFRYFVLQVIFVSTPTIFYFGYVAIRAREDKKKEEEKDVEGVGGSKRGGTVIERDNKHVTKDNGKEKEKQEDSGNGRKVDKAPPEAPKLKGRLLCAYAFSILLKVLIEIGFIIGLWILYGGFFIAAKFECKRFPCPHTVDCFVSRPTEKTIFTIYTQVIAAISLLLNLIEFLHLFQLAISHHLEKRYRTQRQDYLPRSEQVQAGQKSPELQTEVPHAYKVGSQVKLPMQGGAACYSNPCESYGEPTIEVNWGPEEAGSDMLPSYVNCMGAMRTSHSPRAHYKKHAHHTGKNSKGTHKGHSKQKNYV